MVDWDFVKKYASANPAELRLKFLGKGLKGASDSSVILDSILQIECRKRYTRKFPDLFTIYPRFKFPSVLAGEQASNLWVAEYHAGIACGLFENEPSTHYPDKLRLVDMTSGLGIDFITIASAITDNGAGTLAIELDENKAEVLRENLQNAGLADAKVETTDSLSKILSLPDNSIRLLFADPARRGDHDSRLYDPRDCMPDIVGSWDILLKKADWVIVKNSSMLDLQKVLELYPGTVWIAVISVRNECKEVLVIAKENGTLQGIQCVNIIGKEDSSLIQENYEIDGESWKLHDNNTEYCSISDVRTGAYFYESNASVMKTNAWKSLSTSFPGLRKFSPNCNLFLSNEFFAEFPGRKLLLTEIPDKASRKQMKGTKCNVVARNYPLSAAELEKSLKVKPGGEDFIYGVTVGRDEKPLIIKGIPR